MMPTLERHRASPTSRSATHDMHLTPCSLGYLPPKTRFWATSLGFTRNLLVSALTSRIFPHFEFSAVAFQWNKPSFGLSMLFAET